MQLFRQKLFVDYFLASVSESISSNFRSISSLFPWIPVPEMEPAIHPFQWKESCFCMADGAQRSNARITWPFVAVHFAYKSYRCEFRYLHWVKSKEKNAREYGRILKTFWLCSEEVSSCRCFTFRFIWSFKQVEVYFSHGWIRVSPLFFASSERRASRSFTDSFFTRDRFLQSCYFWFQPCSIFGIGCFLSDCTFCYPLSRWLRNNTPL